MQRSNTAPDLFQESKKAKTISSIKANYGPMRNRLLKLAPNVYHCRLFCGGIRCKYCNPDYMSKSQQDLPGLFSTWVTEDILAMSRPTSSGIVKYELLARFRENGIKSVINLQRVCEHQECGPPLDKSGFSYDPEEFMRHEIFHYNFGWPDFGVASLSALLDMVKVMNFALSQGKVAIHCHAGLGRTGVLICCFLMWCRDFTDVQAVEYVRSKRPSSVQTIEQVQLVEQFGSLLKMLKPVFRNDLTFDEYLQQQRLMLHGNEARVLKYVPKIVFIICERLSELFGVNSLDTLAKRVKDLALGQIDDKIDKRGSRKSLPIINQHFTSSVDDDRRLLPSRRNSTIMLNDCFVSNNFPRGSRLPPLVNVTNSGVVISNGLNNKPPIVPSDNKNSKRGDKYNRRSSNPDIVQFLSKAQNADLKTLKSAQMFKETLNSGNFLTRWDDLISEEDPLTLFVLLMDWFHSLKVSILFDEDFDNNKSNKQLIKIPRWTLWYIARLFQILCQADSNTIREASKLMTEMFCWTCTNENVINFMQSCIENIDDLFVV